MSIGATALGNSPRPSRPIDKITGGTITPAQILNAIPRQMRLDGELSRTEADRLSSTYLLQAVNAGGKAGPNAFLLGLSRAFKGIANRLGGEQPSPFDTNGNGSFNIRSELPALLRDPAFQNEVNRFKAMA